VNYHELFVEGSWQRQRHVCRRLAGHGKHATLAEPEGADRFSGARDVEGEVTRRFRSIARTGCGQGV